MEQIKAYFDDIVKLLTAFFALVKALVNTDDVNLDEIGKAAEDAGLKDAAEDLIDAIDA